MRFLVITKFVTEMFLMKNNLISILMMASTLVCCAVLMTFIDYALERQGGKDGKA